MEEFKTETRKVQEESRNYVQEIKKKFQNG